MTSKADDGDWKRLGEQLILRRIQIDPKYRVRTVFARERGINYKLAADVETGYRADFATATLAEIARAYEVTYESIGEALRGGDLVPAEGAPAGAAEAIDDAADPAALLFPDPSQVVERAIWRQTGKSEDLRAEEIRQWRLARERADMERRRDTGLRRPAI